MNLLVDARYVSLGEAGINAVLGFAVVFMGIAILVFVVWLVGYIFKKAEEKKKGEIKAETVKAEEDDEIVAVITSAITAYYGKKKRKPEFVVKNLKKY